MEVSLKLSNKINVLYDRSPELNLLCCRKNGKVLPGVAKWRQNAMLDRKRGCSRHPEFIIITTTDILLPHSLVI